MAVSTSIMLALFTRMEALVLTPSLPVYWPNKTFSPPADNKYLIVQHIPGPVVRLHFGSTEPNLHRGLFQVKVHWPANRGQREVQEVADLIASHFPTDLRMTSSGVTVRVTRQPDVTDLLQSETYVELPVTVPWETLA